MKTITAFYTPIPFWAGKKLSHRTVERIKNPSNELILKEIFVYENDDYVFKICKSGLFIFGISSRFLTENKVTEFDYLNCIGILFQSAIYTNKIVEHNLVSEVSYNDILMLDKKSESFNSHNLKTVYSSHADLRFRTEEKLNEDMIDELVGKIQVPKRVFNKLNSSLSKIYSNQSYIKKLSVYAKSLSEYQRKNYSNSLILSWFIIEPYLYAEWEKFLDSKNKTNEDESKRINKTRKEYLMNGSQYPISVISNMLELFDVLEFKNFTIIDQVRKNRNRIVHQDELYDCKLEDCKKAIDITREILEKEMRIDLSLKLEPIQLSS